MGVRRLSFEPPPVLTVIITINLISLVVLFPVGAGAEESDEPPFPDVSLSTSASVLDLAQAKEPEPPPPEPPTPLEPERPKPERPAEALLLEAGAILLPQGILQVEPSIEYSHWSSNDIAISGFTVFEAIVIGTIRVDELNRDIVTGALTLRYGILDRLQADVRVPALWRQDNEVLAVGTVDERERTTDNFNIGDLEASVSYQALNEQGWIPALIARVKARFPTGENPFEIPTETVNGGLRLTEPPTGSGFYGVGPGVTLVWTSDPVVFYVGGTYLFNLERNFTGFGDINPGNSLEWLAGMNVALSERVALNVTFVDQINWSTDQNGVEVAGTSFNDGRLVLGASVGLSPSVTLLVGAGIGLTDDSPDFTFTVAVPITFKLF